MNPHQYEDSLAEKAIEVSYVALIISMICGVCVLMLFFLRHENPQGWQLAWEPAVFGGMSLFVAILAFLVWALDSYGYFESFFDLTGECKPPKNPFC